MQAITVFTSVTLILSVQCASADYQIGVGIADVTGPPAEINFMGYAQPSQKGEGLHLRQFARAFIIDDGNARLVFVSADIGMIGSGVRRRVLQRLQKKFGKTYNEQNVILSGTHTHSGPGGYLMDVLFDISVLGFVRDSFNAIVDGLVKSIERADSKMVPGEIYLNVGKVEGANINRSPTSYEENPKEERDNYESNTDKELTQLKFQTLDGRPIGVINWFAVHPTSMDNTNRLVSSDNVGYAALLFEGNLNNGALPGRGDFVAAFASSNLGDVSPRTKGPKCKSTGKDCDRRTSSCEGLSQDCEASGPGKDIFESTSIIANKIYSEALRIFDLNQRKIEGPIKYIHQFVHMPKQIIQIDDGHGGNQTVTGCSPAMGYSFAAGTTDGPGAFDFKQGTVTENKYWNLVRDFLQPPSQEDKECQHPKPILFATGKIKFPYEWQPDILSSQIGIIGDVVIAAVPGEFTTMSGRRMRNALKPIADGNGLRDAKIIIAGLSNTYSDYITTFEEYQAQRYEAASTIYGPHTLSIHIHQYQKLLTALLKGKSLERGPVPEDLSTKQISFVTPVILDIPEKDRHFGECVSQPEDSYKIGQTVTAEFVSGHPRNNLMHGKSYLYIEKNNGNRWVQVASDANWETKFSWKRTYLASSRVTIKWDITQNYSPGVYRITHYGHSKSPLVGITSYKGSTKPFTVLARDSIYRRY